VSGAIKNFEELGAKPDDNSYETALANGKLLNETLNSLSVGDTFFVPNSTYTLIGGIIAKNIKGVIIQIDGTLSFSDDRETWPRNSNGDVMECIYLENIEDIIFTSSGKGTLDGNGKEWWGAINFLRHQEDRPRLLHIVTSKNVIIENLLFKDSPFWTFFAEHCDGLIIRYSDVDARWTNANYHTLLDLQAFNTDGFDVTGHNVHIHDCNIWNQDDCIAVKDDPNGSYDMLFERISCSGLGLVIGSIGGSMVNNITFRDSHMPSTVKGIYMKTRWSDSGPVGTAASVSNILYENIVIDDAQQFAIWIGPAQQTGQPCSLLWPIADHATCIMSGYQTWTNITLRNITINNPWGSPGKKRFGSI
jgi:polygalacturonase